MLTESIKASFLAENALKPISITRLPQDASMKTFDRVIDASNQSMLLMHYPETSQNFDKFIDTSKLLIKNTILAPKIFSYDKTHCLVLMQDFGNTSINRYLATNPHTQENTYQQILSTLLKIQSIKLPPGQQQYSNDILLKELNITLNWYFPYLNIEKTPTLTAQYIDLWGEVLTYLPSFDDVFVHRDFHVDNLFKVQNSIGVIDFQDWVQGSPIYDVVSLLDDARVYVCQELRDKAIRYYLDSTGFTYDKLITAYHILGAQRNSRILGVFAHKAIQGNTNYVKFISRVNTYLQNNLVSLPQLSQLACWMKHAKLL